MSTTNKEQNIAIAQNGINNFLQGNIQGILNLCSDDIVWSTHNNPAVPFAKTYHGKAGVARFFSDLTSNVDYKEFSPGTFYCDGDFVFVKTYHNGTVKSTGKSYAHDTMMVFTINDGKMASFFVYVDTADQARAFTK